MGLIDLKKIGLTDGETKLYSALLDLGESTRTELAKKSGVSPSKIYDIANRLLEKGIISSVTKNGVIHFSAANPERIKDFLKKKEEELEAEKKLVDQMLPALLTKYQKTDEETDVEVFYGWEGMKTVFNDIVKTLSKGDHNYVFGASAGKQSKQADIFFSQYFKRVEEKGYAVNIIFNENLRGHKERTEYYSKHAKHKVRYLNQDTFAELNIYGDRVLIILLLENPVIIRIKNKEASKSFKKYFDLAWKLSEK
jgi:HTH-type transcriptional regulator, sugar sensing transcriptional regulator